MKIIAIIGCCNEKLSGHHQAKDLYIGDRFKKAYRYAKNLGIDTIFILSAKYGLIHEKTIIESYNLAYNDLSPLQKLQLSALARQQLNDLAIQYHYDLQNDLFVIIASNSYISIIDQDIKHIYTPIAGLKMDEALQHLDVLNSIDHKQSTTNDTLPQMFANLLESQLIVRDTLRSRIIRCIKSLIDIERIKHNHNSFSIELRAGNIAQIMQLNKRIPVICNAMRAIMKELPNSQQTRNTIKHSSNLYIEYQIPANIEDCNRIFDKLI